ncbi:MAG: hypothetical protein WCY71_12360 [Halothiobacillaceae bacterium]
MVTDMRKTPITTGCSVAKGISLNRAGSAGIQLCWVSLVDGDKVYLDGSNRPVKYPERLLVVPA